MFLQLSNILLSKIILPWYQPSCQGACSPETGIFEIVPFRKDDYIDEQVIYQLQFVRSNGKIYTIHIGLNEKGDFQMPRYAARNRSKSDKNAKGVPAAFRETELVMKLNKDELFDQHVLLPHAELNSIVYSSVDTFVEKYQGEDMTLHICTNSVNPILQDVFREVYRSHYEDEYRKVSRSLKRHYYRVVVLLVISVIAFILSSWIAKFSSTETIVSYLVGNISCFCLWEVGYTQFSSLDLADERKRIIRAMNAEISFQ